MKVGIIETRSVMGTFAMGSALSSFYGVGLGRETTDGKSTKALTKDKMARASKQLQELSLPRYLATNVVPESVMKFLNIPLIREASMNFFYEQVTKIIEQRRQSKRRH